MQKKVCLNVEGCAILSKIRIWGFQDLQDTVFSYLDFTGYPDYLMELNNLLHLTLLKKFALVS